VGLRSLVGPVGEGIASDLKSRTIQIVSQRRKILFFNQVFSHCERHDSDSHWQSFKEAGKVSCIVVLVATVLSFETFTWIVALALLVVMYRLP
jgi:hypothetical protein